MAKSEIIHTKATPEIENNLAIIKSIVTVDGVEPSAEAEKVIVLYSKGEIDYKTAKLALAKMYKQDKQDV